MNPSAHRRLDEALRPRLAERQAQGRYRRRSVVSESHGVHVSMEGRALVNFSGNDYLGLAGDPRLVTAFKKAADHYGVGAGASHLITGHTHAHHALEEEIAEFLGRPRALLFSTGYMANLGIGSALLDAHDCVVGDRLNHASLLDAVAHSSARLRRYRHLDVDSADRQLQKCVAPGRWLVSDGVFSMDGDLAPLARLSGLAERHRAVLWIDDAHGFGVLGRHGRGTLEYQHIGNDQVPVLMCTLGKALGTAGAVVSGSETLIETLIQSARSYLYTTAMPAAVAEASRVALDLLKTETWRRERLHANICTLRDGIAQLGLSVGDDPTPILPLRFDDDNKANDASRRLADLGFHVSAIRPPTVPVGTARLRITVSAAHEQVHLDGLLDAIEAVLR